MERKESRPGYTRVTLDLPTPLYRRLRDFVEAHRQWGASEQQVCRTFIDEGLTRQGQPPDEPKARKGNRKRKPKP